MTRNIVHTVGEIFEFNDGDKIVKLKVENNIYCRDCYFCNKDCRSMRDSIGVCASLFRYDNKSIIFKQVI